MKTGLMTTTLQLTTVKQLELTQTMKGGNPVAIIREGNDKILLSASEIRRVVQFLTDLTGGVQ